MNVLPAFCIGVDVSKDSLTVQCVERLGDSSLAFSEVIEFENRPSGYRKILNWAKKQTGVQVDIDFVTEATGSYHEQFVYWMDFRAQTLHVEPATRVKNFSLSLSVKSKTDSIDAGILARMGVERQLRVWTPPNPKILELRDLSRYRQQLVEQRTMFTNFHHHQQVGHDQARFIDKSTRKSMKFLDKQIEACVDEMQQWNERNPQWAERITRLISIPGIGMITAQTVVAETLGFEQFTSGRQVSSFAGYDVVQRTSGTSVRGKTRISKKGNRRIRRAMFMPALSAMRNQRFGAIYNRIKDRSGNGKIANTALQRRMLVIIFARWKNGTVYDPEYLNKVAPKQEATQDQLKELSFG